MNIQIDSIRNSLMGKAQVIVIQITLLEDNTKWIKWFHNDTLVWFSPDQVSEYYPVWVDIQNIGIHIIKATDCFGNEASIQIDDDYIQEIVASYINEAG